MKEALEAQRICEDAQVELEYLQDRYPPKLFKDSSELETWLAGQPDPPKAVDAVLWYRHALDLQAAAVKDGYLISAVITDEDKDGLYLVWCSACLKDGSLYLWDPETDDLHYWLDYRHF